MAIRDWTRGQLVVFWLALALVAFLAVFALAVVGLLIDDRYNPFFSDIAIGVALGFVIFCCPPGLWVTWKWLGRQHARRSTTSTE